MKLDDYLSTVEPNIALAKKTGFNPVLLSQWRNDARPVPISSCPEVERATGGLVTCEEMRGDVAWVRIQDKRWPHQKGRPLVDHAQKAASAKSSADQPVADGGKQASRMCEGGCQA